MRPPFHAPHFSRFLQGGYSIGVALPQTIALQGNRAAFKAIAIINLH